MPVAPLPDLDTLDTTALKDMVIRQHAQLSSHDAEVERVHPASGLECQSTARLLILPWNPTAAIRFSNILQHGRERTVTLMRQLPVEQDAQELSRR